MLLFYADLYSQNIRNSNELVYQRGLLHLQLGHFDAAEQLFQTMIQNDKEDARGYYGLGRVHFTQNPKSARARHAFARATRLDGSLADAWLYLAKSMAAQNFMLYKIRPVFQKAIMLNQNWPEAWDFWIDTCLNRRGGSAILFKDFQSALHDSPDNPIIYNRFILTALRHYRESDAAAVLESLYDKYPKNPTIARDLVRMLTLAGKHQKCLEVLRDMHNDSLLSKTVIYRFKALNQFADNDTVEAAQAYWESIQALHDSSDAAILSDDVRFISTSEEWQKLKSVPIDSLSRFYNIFWRSRDPLPSTPINERLVDHLHRLNYVSSYCRRFGNIDLFRYDSRVFLGDEILKELNIFDARCEERSLDDMGLTIMRCGLVQHAL